MTFHRIAYEALDVCNAVEMATVEAMVSRTGLRPGARVLDIGCGNGAVAIRLAGRFGFMVDAVELDPSMADLARSRVAAAPSGERVTVHQVRSASVLAESPPFDLIVALGVTEPVGAGVRHPEAMFTGLARHLVAGGWLLWGDLVWTAEPSEPLKRVVELNNTYADDAGWRAAARAACLEVVWAELSTETVWTTYRTTMDRAVADWLAAHPGHPDAAAVRTRAERIFMMLDFGRDAMGFGLYLLRKT